MDEEALFESEAFAALKDALVAYALPKNIAALKRDLGKYRIDYDVWFHESTLHESGAVLAVVDKLLELGACYKAEDGAIMYRSAQYAAKYGTVNKKKTEDGTEEEAKDEVLVRANGIPTYFAADIAYHYNKLATRGFAKAIDVWGADHHGHVARMKAPWMPSAEWRGSGRCIDADGQPDAGRPACPYVQAHRQRHHPDRPAGGSAHRQRTLPVQYARRRQRHRL